VFGGTVSKGTIILYRLWTTTKLGFVGALMSTIALPSYAADNTSNVSKTSKEPVVEIIEEVRVTKVADTSNDKTSKSEAPKDKAKQLRNSLKPKKLL